MFSIQPTYRFVIVVLILILIAIVHLIFEIVKFVEAKEKILIQVLLEGSYRKNIPSFNKVLVYLISLPSYSGKVLKCISELK